MLVKLVIEGGAPSISKSENLLLRPKRLNTFCLCAFCQNSPYVFLHIFLGKNTVLEGIKAGSVNKFAESLTLFAVFTVIGKNLVSHV